jgi:hypothetical protein
MTDIERRLQERKELQESVYKKLAAIGVETTESIIFDAMQDLKRIQRSPIAALKPLTAEDKAQKCKWCHHLLRYHTGVAGSNGNAVCKYGCKYCRGFELLVARSVPEK